MILIGNLIGNLEVIDFSRQTIRKHITRHVYVKLVILNTYVIISAFISCIILIG